MVDEVKALQAEVDRLNAEIDQLRSKYHSTHTHWRGLVMEIVDLVWLDNTPENILGAIIRILSDEGLEPQKDGDRS